MDQTDSGLIRVCMNLTRKDRENAATLRVRQGLRSRTSAVSMALEISAFVMTELKQGSEFLLLRSDGRLEKIVILI